MATVISVSGLRIEYQDDGHILFQHSEQTYRICEQRADARYGDKRLAGIRTQSVDRDNDARLDLGGAVSEGASAILLGGKMLQKPGEQARTEHWGVEAPRADGSRLTGYVKSRTQRHWDFLVPLKFQRTYFTADIGILAWTFSGNPYLVEIVGYLTSEDWYAHSRQQRFGDHGLTWTYAWQKARPLVEVEALLGRPLKGRE